MKLSLLRYAYLTMNFRNFLSKDFNSLVPPNYCKVDDVSITYCFGKLIVKWIQIKIKFETFLNFRFS